MAVQPNQRLPFNATTFEGAHQYLNVRRTQILGQGGREIARRQLDHGLHSIYKWNGEFYQAVYVLDQFRGNGRYKAMLLPNVPILTFDRCNLEPYLLRQGLDYVALKQYCPQEYLAIEEFYGSRKTKRSRVFLMEHIEEGLVILERIQASDLAKRAYCLHPLVQEDQDFLQSMDQGRLQGLPRDSVAAAMEYRHVANAHLSFHPPEAEIRLSPLKAVNEALIADKVQNRKDFERYHKYTHPRSAELDAYFRRWLDRLGISEVQYQNLIEGL